MTQFKCKMCGGDVVVQGEETFGTCSSCGSKMSIPLLNSEKRTNLYNRANHYRRMNDYDQALNIYEMILNEQANDPEAHWGCVLSKYGIEYVEDPLTNKMKPTVHRVQKQSILMDPDYLMALEYALDYQAKAIYEQEATIIHEIQKTILSISQDAEDYDVFICYKELSETGGRTKDSKIAEEIYATLVGEGYRVFYSRITLESHLGKEYEPYIFSALNSSKVMLVVGTKPEYLNSVWVRNEWSRFLSMMKVDPSKIIIPCYVDMTVNDLPIELSVFQGQEATKIGFIQDVIKSIKRTSQVKQSETSESQFISTPTVDALLKRIKLFFEDGDLSSANDYIECVLDIDPENGEAYLGKLLIELNCKTMEELKNCFPSIEHYSNFKRAIQYGNPTLVSSLQQIVKSMNETILIQTEEIAPLRKLWEQSLKEEKYGTALRCHNQIKMISEKYSIPLDFDTSFNIPDTIIALYRNDQIKKFEYDPADSTVIILDQKKDMTISNRRKGLFIFPLEVEMDTVNAEIEFTAVKEIQAHKKTIEVELGKVTHIEVGVYSLDEETKVITNYIKISTKTVEELNKAAEPSGCYIATSAYGSYDCPQVWTLRRYRDQRLALSTLGQAFIKVYYAVSPSVVKSLGRFRLFNSINRMILNHVVSKLRKRGFENTPYID